MGILVLGFIGAGRVGCSLARYFYDNGVTVAGVYTRGENRSGFSSFCSADELVRSCDTVFITVNDAAIAEVWHGIGADAADGRVICHCSGSAASDIFAGADEELVCSVHPMLAFSSKETSAEQIRRAFFTLEGGSSAVMRMAELLDSCGNEYKIISRDCKPLYHAAACFASNLVTAVCSEALELMRKCGFSNNEALEALTPLIEENVRNICEKGIKQSLTGPVSRGDAVTVSEHLRALDGRQRDIYIQLSRVLAELSGHTELADLLSGEDR